MSNWGSDLRYHIEMAIEKIEVTAYAGHRDDERPMAFSLHGEGIEVFAILRRWIEEDIENRARKRFFLVRGSDSYVHKIYFDEEKREWFAVT